MTAKPLLADYPSNTPPAAGGAYLLRHPRLDCRLPERGGFLDLEACDQGVQLESQTSQLAAGGSCLIRARGTLYG